ncbi:MAG: sigma-E processing peptidase SpoIIGA [Faecalibacterium sp.]|jgi:hypothetical protein|nr:sigma-E processing peptidase SpoIIGA [Faecalibacterium sp.]
MKTVIYLDVLLLVNFVVAAFLLAGCAVLCGAECRVLRLLAASGLAAFCSLILLAPKLPLAVQFLYQAATAATILRLAFCWQGRRAFLRQCVWYLLLNLTMTGIVIFASMQGFDFVQTNNLACYFGISPLLLFGCVAGLYFLLRLLVMLFGKPAGGARWQLTLCLDGLPLTAAACYDTGFALEDALTGRPAVLFHYPQVKTQLAPALCGYLDAALSGGAAKAPPPSAALHVRFVECRTVTGTALLPAVTAETFCIQCGPAHYRGEKILAVFSGEAAPDTRCPALFGPGLLDYSHRRREEHAFHSCKHASV